MVSQTPSAPTAPSSSGPASPLVWRSRSTTSTAARRLHTGASSRNPTPATGAGWLPAILPSLAMASRPRLPAKCVVIQTSLTCLTPCPTGLVGFPAVGTPIPGFSATSSAGTNSYGGFNAPDIVGNLRVDQAWGSAQLMGALHEVNSLYYGGTIVTDSRGHRHCCRPPRVTRWAGRSAPASSGTSRGSLPATTSKRRSTTRKAPCGTSSTDPNVQPGVS